MGTTSFANCQNRIPTETDEYNSATTKYNADVQLLKILLRISNAPPFAPRSCDTVSKDG